MYAHHYIRSHRIDQKNYGLRVGTTLMCLRKVVRKELSQCTRIVSSNLHHNLQIISFL